MNSIPPALSARLAQLGLQPASITHPPVHTVEQAEEYWSRLSGISVKNLFLKDAASALFLVVIPGDVTIDLKALPALIGSKRLSFARDGDLASTLAVERGAVSPLAVLNDYRGQARVVIHAGLTGEQLLKIHPMTNEATLAMSGQDIVAFLDSCGHAPIIVDLAKLFRKS